jgi:tRNA threonylcarbamoyladenosine biosynthesis protein TsaB
MTLLGLDTSHTEGSLCLQRDSSVLELFNWKQEKSHAELLAGYLVQALKNHKLEQKDIDAYAVNIGPGSFTGIRISINTIKTLAFVTGKPIYTFTSLEVIAQSCSLECENLTIAINAHSELCYMGKFVKSADRWVLEDKISVISALKLNDILSEPNTLFAGDAFEVYKDKIDSSIKINKPKNHKDIPSALYLNELVTKNKSGVKPIFWESLEPFYLRLSSPEEKQAASQNP